MISGGLDSTLAAALLLKQGIEVLGINFYTGFCVTEHHRRLGIPGRDGQACRNEALRAGADLEFEVRMVDIAEEYYDVITSPKYGYGSAANPCIDCRMFMLGKARQIMQEEGADFVFTGEVIGQRPKSQRRPIIDLIEQKSGLAGRLLRPLSAKLLPMTIPEKEGLVDREGLAGIWGRSRETQFALAKELGITDFPQPAGGCCFLADANFAHKFFDFVGHANGKRITQEDAVLLGTGRHFRLSEATKLIVGRNEHENRVLQQFAGDRIFLIPAEVMGPSALIEGPADKAVLEQAAAVAARYCDRTAGEAVGKALVKFSCTRTVEGARREIILSVRPAAPEAIDSLRIIPPSSALNAV